jgi:hypothetical protein
MVMTEEEALMNRSETLRKGVASALLIKAIRTQKAPDGHRMGVLTQPPNCHLSKYFCILGSAGNGDNETH